MLLKQKRKLEVDINYLSIIGHQAKTKAIADKEAEVTTQNATVTLLQTQVNGCQNRYNTEKNNPLNYWCKLICRVNENWIARIYTNNKALLYADVGANGDPYNNNYFKFVATNNGYYRIISRYEDRALRGDSKAQVYSDVNGTGIRYEWKPEKFGNYYLIRHRSTGEVLDRGGGDYGVGIWPEHTGNHQQWKIIIIGGETNNNIGNAQENLRSKEGELTRAQNRLSCCTFKL